MSERTYEWEYLEELLWNDGTGDGLYELVWEGNPDEHRWYTNYDVVVRDTRDGTLWLFDYDKPATECQEADNDYPRTLVPAEEICVVSYRKVPKDA